MQKFRFHSIYWELTFFLQILYMHSYWQDLAWDFYTSFFAHLYQNHDPWFTPIFFFQYLENKMTEFHQILYMHSYWQDLLKDCCTLFFTNQTNKILTRSLLGLLHIIFRTFVPELWPLIYSKSLFPLNILRTNGQILT